MNVWKKKINKQKKNENFNKMCAKLLYNLIGTYLYVHKIINYMNSLSHIVVGSNLYFNVI